MASFQGMQATCHVRVTNTASLMLVGSRQWRGGRNVTWDLQ